MVCVKMYFSQFLPSPFHTSDTYMRTLANTEYHDEMKHNAAYHQGLHCLPSLTNAIVRERTYHFIWNDYNL